MRHLIIVSRIFTNMNTLWIQIKVTQVGRLQKASC